MAARRGLKGLLGRPVKFRSELWRARPFGLKISQKKTSPNLPCSTTPCTMFRTCPQAELWLYGQLIVYIFGGNRGFSGHNRP
eukprot:scaffold9504_cov236-Skeletonema_dohrnii-CCMP3373.AAC.1